MDFEGQIRVCHIEKGTSIQKNNSAHSETGKDQMRSWWLDQSWYVWEGIGVIVHRLGKMIMTKNIIVLLILFAYMFTHLFQGAIMEAVKKTD